MGLFGKREEVISDKSEEYVLKEELETEVENIQKEFRTKQDELNEHSHSDLLSGFRFNDSTSQLSALRCSTAVQNSDSHVSTRRQHQSTRTSAQHTSSS